MKKEPTKSKPGLSNDSPDKFSTIDFRKKNKKRILPEAFYPRWELELLSSFVLIFILWILPDWIADTNNLMDSKFDVIINSTWMDFVSKIVMAGFIISFILRAIWLSMVWKWHSDKPSHGDQMFKSQTTREMHSQSLGIQKLATVIDEVAELVFFISSIIFFIAFLSYVIQVLGSLLNHSVSKSQEMQSH